MKAPFSKPPLTFAQQLDRIIKRGLTCPNPLLALRYLTHINYYRLAAYFLPFEADHATHAFRPGACFDDVLDLYVFDRKLRLLALDAIERVEVSVRTGWAYAHAHLDAALFGARWNYVQQRQKLTDETRESQETLPVWQDKGENDGNE
jgi:abortive infection bacteriophage resistance protein